LLSSTGRKSSCSSQWLAEKKAAARHEPVPETEVKATTFAMLKHLKDPPLEREEERAKDSIRISLWQPWQSSRVCSAMGMPESHVWKLPEHVEVHQLI